MGIHSAFVNCFLADIFIFICAISPNILMKNSTRLPTQYLFRMLKDTCLETEIRLYLIPHTLVDDVRLTSFSSHLVADAFECCQMMEEQEGMLGNQVLQGILGMHAKNRTKTELMFTIKTSNILFCKNI